MTQDPFAPIGVIAHYNLLERIDSAGLGDLYRARDTRRGRTVGVRVLPVDFTDDRAGLIERAQAVQTLSHPNAITVFDVANTTAGSTLCSSFSRVDRYGPRWAGVRSTSAVRST